jgi:hypothetical protein
VLSHSSASCWKSSASAPAESIVGSEAIGDKK